MQLICDGLDLSEAVLKVSKAMASKTTNPILEGIKLVAEDDTLTLIATDMELSIEKKIKAEIKQEGETVVPGKFFSEFIKKLTNEKLELILNDKEQLKIKYVDSESFIQCYSTSEFPDFKLIESDEYFGVGQKQFKSIINKSIFAVAVDNSRPILKGCLLEVEENFLTAVALDGYRLALARTPIANSNIKKNVIIPAKSLNEISKLLDDTSDIVNIYIENNYVMVDLGDTKVISRLLEGDFINYNQIISNEFATNIKVNKAQFEDALERASLLSKIGQNNLVKFEIKESNLCVTSNSELGNVKENVSITLSGKDLVIAFNARYFMECFRAIDDEFINIGFNSPSNPCIVTPIEEKAREGFLFLILPVRMM